MTNAPDLKRVPHAVQGYIHDLEERVAGDTKRIGELSQRIERMRSINDAHQGY